MVSTIARFRKGLALFLIVILLNGLLSCNYYTYFVDSQPSVEKIDKLKNSPNYIIVHRADQAFHLRNVFVNQQEQTMAGTLQALTPDHLQYLETKPFAGSTNRYKKKAGVNSSRFVVNEVHLYVKDISLQEGSDITIPLSSIEKIEVYDPDTGATTASHIFGAIGVAAGVLTVIFIIILLTKSSCPFVFVNNGEEYVFAGEIFSGAIFKGLERDDYLVLPHLNVDSTLEITVSNKLKEQQFINQLGVTQISHPVGSRAIPDRAGKMHLIRNVYPLSKAEVNNEEITALLQAHDSTHFTFNSESGVDFFNDVTVTFPKPNGATEGHLILHAKNSLWGDYLFGEFTRLFGSSYTRWIDKQDKKPAIEVGKWSEEQGLAMKVYLESDKGWMPVDLVDFVGPLAFRDVVIPLDLSSHNSDSINVKLSAGFMMWDLDYVGLDFTKDENMTLVQLKPESAISSDRTDVLAAIAKNDGDYLIQKNVGDEVMLTFNLPIGARAGFQNDFVLHSKGYYHHVREYQGSAQKISLLSFREQGRFSRFSKEKLDELNQLMQLTEISASIKKE